MTDILKLNISSALCELKETLNILLTQIKGRNPCIQNEDFFDLRLIFTELLMNAIIHGNRYDVHKKVYIIVEFSEEGITSIIMDEGNGFNYHEVLNSGTADVYSETGRGVRLVRFLTDELFFNNKGNEIKFVKKFQ